MARAPATSLGRIGRQRIVRNCKVLPLPDHVFARLLIHQGMHGSLGRDNTFNNMAAIGPDFKSHFVDFSPVGNADIVPTLAQILGFQLSSNGDLKGRVIVEALKGGPFAVFFERQALISQKAGSGQSTALEFQRVGSRLYFDEACFVKPNPFHFFNPATSLVPECRSTRVPHFSRHLPEVGLLYFLLEGSGQQPGATHIAHFAMCGFCPPLLRHQSNSMLALYLAKRPTQSRKTRMSGHSAGQINHVV